MNNDSTDKYYKVASQFQKGELTLIRVGMNVLYRDSYDTVIRISEASNKKQVEITHRAAKIAYDLGVDVLPPLSASPIEIDDYLITLWPWKEPIEPTRYEMGRTTAQFHQITSELQKRLALDPKNKAHNHVEAKIKNISKRIDTLAEYCTQEEHRQLQERFDDIVKRVKSSLKSEEIFTNSIVHGDIHAKNFLGTTLIDLDELGLGPICVDWVKILIDESRFGVDPDHFQEFERGYNIISKINYENYEPFYDLAELSNATWQVDIIDRRPELLEEMLHRVRTINELEAIWHYTP